MMMEIHQVEMAVVFHDVIMKDCIIVIHNITIRKIFHGQAVLQWEILVVLADEMELVLAGVQHDLIHHILLAKIIANATMVPVIHWQCVWQEWTVEQMAMGIVVMAIVMVMCVSVLPADDLARADHGMDQVCMMQMIVGIVP